MNGYITMSAKETERIPVLEKLTAKQMKQKDAAKLLGVSIRQIRRQLKRYIADGARGLVHRGRGRQGNRAIVQSEKDRITDIVKDHYPDFGPTFAHEKLVEHHHVTCSDETIRNIMTKANIWKPRTRKVNTHTYRERRACIGELVQVDGSPHQWFEDRDDACTLICFIDDATSEIMSGAFMDHEGTFTYFEATEHYLTTHGKPLSWYVDKHSTFRINRQATADEDLRDTQAQSQFARAMDELHIQLIFANSPQAKGRVERLYETLQDRLVKELRLEGISDKKTATRYFRDVYIPKHNARFAVPPKECANLHRPLSPTDNLSRIFTIQSKRVVSKDLIVQYKNTRYQLIPPAGYRYTLRNASVTVEETKTSTLTIRYKNQVIPYDIAVQAVHNLRRMQVVSTKEFNENRVYIPAPDHREQREFSYA